MADAALPDLQTQENSQNTGSICPASQPAHSCGNNYMSVTHSVSCKAYVRTLAVVAVQTQCTTDAYNYTCACALHHLALTDPRPAGRWQAANRTL